jgi:hypothetical protein
LDVGSGSSEVGRRPYQPGVSFEIFQNGSAAARMKWKPETSVSVGVPTLDEFAGCLLKGGERHPVPLRQKSQVHIAAKRSLMTKFTQKIAHAGMVLQIPGRQVRWQPPDLEDPRCRTRLERPLQYGSKQRGIALCPQPQPVVQIAFGAKLLRRDEHSAACAKRARKRDGLVGRTLYAMGLMHIGSGRIRYAAYATR